MIHFSVIVPTYNRFSKLQGILTSLTEQTFPTDQFEVLVVNDGSSDAEYAQFHDLKKQYPSLQLQLFEQQNSGAATARNVGVNAASGEFVLFIGDDTYAHPDLLREHYRFHEIHPNNCVLGFVDWYPKLELNEIMKFIAPYGLQFDFRIKNPLDCGYRRFYTSNISVQRSLLESDPFLRDFPGCNWEDIELGYRLHRSGIKIVYNPQAVVYHDHQYQLEQFLQRQERSGENKTIFLKLHPELRTLWSNHIFLRLMLLKCTLQIVIGSLCHLNRIRLRGLCLKAYIVAFLKTDTKSAN